MRGILFHICHTSPYSSIYLLNIYIYIHLNKTSSHIIKFTASCVKDGGGGGGEGFHQRGIIQTHGKNCYTVHNQSRIISADKCIYTSLVRLY